MPKYRVSINWHEYGFIDIEAKNEDQAKDKAREHMANDGSIFTNKSDYDIVEVTLNE